MATLNELWENEKAGKLLTEIDCIHKVEEGLRRWLDPNFLSAAGFDGSEEILRTPNTQHPQINVFRVIGKPVTIGDKKYYFRMENGIPIPFGSSPNGRTTLIVRSEERDPEKSYRRDYAISIPLSDEATEIYSVQEANKRILIQITSDIIESQNPTRRRF
jgi:hypothetical protein